MKTVFEDGSITLKRSGTRLLAAWLNKVFSHRHDGINQDGSAPLDYALAGGAANALTLELTPSLTAHVIGMPVNIQIAAANTGAVTIAVDGLGPVPLTKRGDTALAAGDLAVGQ